MLSRYTLNALPGKIIKINFDHFNVKPDRKTAWCLKDSLSIVGRKHCGRESIGLGKKSMPAKTMYVFAESTEILWETWGFDDSSFSFSWESVENPNGIAPSAPLQSAAGFNHHMEVKKVVQEYFLTNRLSFSSKI